MKLTPEHLTQLYQFTRQHYVVHYDLQTELVDHLANDIETLWETKPKLNFNEARDVSFKKFGVFGFMDVVEARQKAMRKRYLKILWSFVKEWFTFPKLIFTLLLFFTCNLLFALTIGKYIIIASFSVLFIWMIFKSQKYTKYIKKKEKSSIKLWLLEDIIFRNATANTMLLVSLFIQSYNLFDWFWLSKYSVLIASAVFTFFTIHTYVTIIVLPKQSENLLKKTYPEYSL